MYILYLRNSKCIETAPSFYTGENMDCMDLDQSISVTLLVMVATHYSTPAIPHLAYSQASRDGRSNDHPATRLPRVALVPSRKGFLASLKP